MTLIARDDLTPMLESYGVVSIINDLATQNASATRARTVIEWEMSKCGINITELSQHQLEILVIDLKTAGKLDNASATEGGTWDGVVRPVAVSGLGIGGGNVWFGGYEGQTWSESHNTGTFRFYVNGELKQTLTNYYITDLVSLGAISGDIVQICQVSNGIVGWWKSISVP